MTQSKRADGPLLVGAAGGRLPWVCLDGVQIFPTNFFLSAHDFLVLAWWLTKFWLPLESCQLFFSELQKTTIIGEISTHTHQNASKVVVF
jgi:hypothetical protein